MTIIRGTLIPPTLAGAPASPTAGQLYYNSSDGNLYVYDGVAVAWVDLTVQGGVGVGGVSTSAANTWTAQQTFQPATDVTSIIAKHSAAANTAYLQEWQDSGGVRHAHVDSSGNVIAGRVSTTAGQEGLFCGDIGFGTFSYFGIAHAAMATQINYALIQNNVGATLLNAAAGQSIEFRINNAGFAAFDSGGNPKGKLGFVTTQKWGCD